MQVTCPVPHGKATHGSSGQTGWGTGREAAWADAHTCFCPFWTTCHWTFWKGILARPHLPRPCPPHPLTSSA